MNPVGKVPWSFILLNIFQQTCSKVQNHAYFIALQKKVLHFGNVLSHLFEKYISGDENAVINLDSSKELFSPFEYENAAESYVDPTYVIMGVVCFACIISWYIRKRKKKQKKTKTSPKVSPNQTFKKDYEKLNKIHKILQTLKHQLTSPCRPSKIPRLLILHGEKDNRKRKLPDRNESSYSSRGQNVERKLNEEELRHNLQTALQLLEEEMTDEKSTPEESSRYQEIDTPRALFDHKDGAVTLNENHWNPINSQYGMEVKNVRDWARDFGNDETILPVTDEYGDAKISHLKGQKCSKTRANKYAKDWILPAAAARNYGYYRNYSPRSNKKLKRLSKSLYSNSASLPNSRRLSNGDLKRKLDAALQLLDNDDVVDETATDETLKLYPEGCMPEWNVDTDDRAFYEHENEWNKLGPRSFNLHFPSDRRNEGERVKCTGRSGFISRAEETIGQHGSFNHGERNEDGEVCTECLKCIPHRQIECEGRNGVKEAEVKSHCIGYSKPYELELFTPDINLNNLQQMSTGSKIGSVGNFPNRTAMPGKAVDNYNISAKEKALNIEILFNRNIRLAK